MSENKTRYKNVFQSVFEVDDETLASNPGYQGIDGWDSVGHMAFMAALEDEFAIELDIDDIIDFSSYEFGMTILAKYGVDVTQ
jgi:acyl carrier protein